jgi:N-acetylglucosamine malate deacetylase 1
MDNRILVISPHPDDESIGCGGTLHIHALAGDEIRIVFLTSGEGGGHGLAPAETMLLREEEARAAARVLGVSDIDFWRQNDGRLRATASLVDRMRILMCDFVPGRVYVSHPGEAHRDHRAAARIARMAINQADIDTNLLGFEVWTPLVSLDEIVDITPHIETKLAAIRCHDSQCKVLRFDDAALGLSRYRGELNCWPKGTEENTGQYAEVFTRL